MNKEERLEQTKKDTGDPTDTVHYLKGRRHENGAYHNDPECYQFKGRSGQKDCTRKEAQSYGLFPCSECVVGRDRTRAEARKRYLGYQIETDVTLDEVRELSLEELVERVKP